MTARKYASPEAFKQALEDRPEIHNLESTKWLAAFPL